MNEYYIKKGKKYIPVGYSDLPNNIPFGIWYVRKNDSGTSYTNLLSWIETETTDLKKIVSQVDFAGKLTNVLSEMEVKFSLYDMSLYNFAEEIAKKIIK